MCTFRPYSYMRVCVVYPAPPPPPSPPSAGEAKENIRLRKEASQPWRRHLLTCAFGGQHTQSRDSKRHHLSLSMDVGQANSHVFFLWA